MTLKSVLPVLSKILTRSVELPLALWLTCSIALAAGCYRDAPPLSPQATTDLLIALLDDRDPAIRLTAAEALGKIGDQKAEPFLYRALHDSDPGVREAAAKSVGLLPAADAQTETALVMLLRDANAPVRRAAAQALGNRERRPALAITLAGLLTSPDTAVRQAAGHALLLVDGRGALTALSEGTTDSDPAVRQWAAAALGETGDARAVSVLLKRLRDDAVANVRAEAVYRLRFFEKGSLAPEIETIVQQDSSLDVKRWAGKSSIDSQGISTSVQGLD